MQFSQISYLVVQIKAYLRTTDSIKDGTEVHPQLSPPGDF